MLESAANLAVNEIHRRLSEQPEDIPPHVLGTFVAKLVSLIERKDQAEEEQAEDFSLLEQVDRLPAERATELLVSECARLAELHNAHWAKLQLLVGEERAYELLDEREEH